MGSPVWSHEGIYAVSNAHKDKVKITFSHGAELLDPNKLFNAGLGGNEWRAIDFREEDRIDGTALKALRREAVAFNTKQPASKRRGPAVAAKPTLLSGGNPQIAKADGDAPVQAYIAAMPDRKSEVGRRLDDLIVGNAPTVRKAVRWNSPFYGIEGQGWFATCHVFIRYVEVTFLCGASLSPVPPGSGKDKDSRWIDIYEGKLDEEQLADWIRQAAALPGWRGF